MTCSRNSPPMVGIVQVDRCRRDEQSGAHYPQPGGYGPAGTVCPAVRADAGTRRGRASATARAVSSHNRHRRWRCRPALPARTR
jgi:hypothetical protein